MGVRFRRSIKICKGLRVNFNKDSVGLSIGGRGYGYTINSKGRKTAHIGIPGTGLSYVNSISSHSNKEIKVDESGREYVETEISFKLDENGKMRFFYSNGEEITDVALVNRIKRMPEYKAQKENIENERYKSISNEVKDFNEQNKELINIYKLAPSKIYSEKEYIDELNNVKQRNAYIAKVFDKPMPDKSKIEASLYEEAKNNIKSMAFWSIASKRNDYVNEKLESEYNKQLDNWNKEKAIFEKVENIKAQEDLLKAEDEYNNLKQYFNNIISGDEECICNDIDNWFDELEMPLEFNIDYDYLKNENKILIDLDLPEIEDFPNKDAVQLANGNIKYRNKTQNEIYADYNKYVFGLAIFIVGHIFNISPKIHNILISGYTQRRNNVGDIINEYIYSIKFNRDELSQYSLNNSQPLDICMKFTNRCNINANYSLKAIEPFEE